MVFRNIGENLGVVRPNNDGVKQIERWALTTEGKIRAEEGDIVGPQSEVVAALEEDVIGKMTKREISNRTKISETQVGSLLRKLEQAGYVQKARD